MKKKFGIIGNPIKHSLSPVLHKYWFDKYGLDASYSIIETKNEDLKDVFKRIRNHELAGINVTLPFKQKVINQTDQIVNDAELTGSVNTILLENNKIIGENTDVFGLQAAYLKEIDSLLNKSALIIGAGGVSPSVILSLQKSGIKEITITNRTNEKCLFLKKKFSYINVAPWKNLKDEIKKFDIIINATSLGLKMDDWISIFQITKENVVYIDTIYNPLETKTYKFQKKKVESL